MPGSNGNGLRPEEEIAQNVGSPAGQGNTKSALGWAGLGLGVVDTVANFYMTDRQNRLNREESERARQHNIDMWNMQNAYNHPAAQMERLREAGLNPNLVYGTPDITGNNANAPEDSKTHYERPNDLDMLGMAMNAQQFAKDSDLYNLKLEEQELDNERKRIDNEYRLKELGNYQYEFNMKIERHKKWLESEDVKIDFTKAQAERERAETSFTQFSEEASRLKLPKELEALDLGNELTREKINECKKYQDVLSQQIDTLKAQAAKYYAEAAKAQNEAELAKIQAKWAPILNQKLLEVQESSKNLNNANAELMKEEKKYVGKKAKAQAFKAYTSGVSDLLSSASDVISCFTPVGAVGKVGSKLVGGSKTKSSPDYSQHDGYDFSHIGE